MFGQVPNRFSKEEPLGIAGLRFFSGPNDAIPVIKPTASKHRRNTQVYHTSDVDTPRWVSE